MAKKVKVKKTLVEQILSKAGIQHQGIQINALEGELPQGYEQNQIFKTLALLGDKTGPIIGIVPITQHLSEKKLAKISGNKKVSMIPQKDLEKITGYIHGANNPVGIRQKHNYPIFIDKNGVIVFLTNSDRIISSMNITCCFFQVLLGNHAHFFIARNFG